MPIFRILGLLLLLKSSLWSFTPLHQEVAESPLLYLRLPVLWDRAELAKPQKEQLTTALLQALTKPGKAGFAQRQVLAMLKGSLEILALPPENRFLPAPGLALRAKFYGGQDEMSKRLQALIIAMVEEFQGQPADWLKFKRKVEKGVITDSAFLLGRVTLITEKEQFTLMFSQSNPNFPEKFKAKAKTNFESDQNSDETDFTMYADVDLSLSFYLDWMKRVAQNELNTLTQSGVVDLKLIKFWTEGKSESFSVKSKINLGSKINSKWSQLSSAKKAKTQYPDIGSFKGSLLWPSLKANDWMSCFSVFSFIDSSDRMKYAKLAEQIKGPVAFSWRETSIAPIISAELKDVKASEAALAKMLAPNIQITKESGTSSRHVLWGENSVSYNIEGQKLIFSPLLQSLRDLKSSGVAAEQTSLIKIEYPLSGQVSGNYYSLMHIVLQAIVNSGAAMDPKVFPAFSNLNIKDRPWSDKGKFELKRNKQILEMTWNQPFGLPGLASGVKLPSSSWVYFLSLASLTSNSVKYQ